MSFIIYILISSYQRRDNESHVANKYCEKRLIRFITQSSLSICEQWKKNEIECCAELNINYYYHRKRLYYIISLLSAINVGEFYRQLQRNIWGILAAFIRKCLPIAFFRKRENIHIQMWIKFYFICNLRNIAPGTTQNSPKSRKFIIHKMYTRHIDVIFS